MTDAMLWTLIGGFLTILTVMGGLVLRMIAGVRIEISSLEKVMDTRFDSVTTRLDAIDRDVWWLMEQYGRKKGEEA